MHGLPGVKDTVFGLPPLVSPRNAIWNKEGEEEEMVGLEKRWKASVGQH